ncbi:hypothetical protein OIU76_026503 [Salix suchowensis]|nr:hypothetical protein OIU76_026503 [Salix suchowensis]
MFYVSSSIIEDGCRTLIDSHREDPILGIINCYWLLILLLLHVVFIGGLRAKTYFRSHIASLPYRINCRVNKPCTRL